MTQIHIPGFPRMGAQRELKFALESFWRGECTRAALEETGRTLRTQHWAWQREAGLEWVTVGDFAFYDQVANHIQLLGCEPERFGFSGQEAELARYFTMARGVAAETGSWCEGEEAKQVAHAKYGTQSDCCGVSHASLAAGTPALEMTKWFDTNYHYLVPEFGVDTVFSLASERLFNEVKEAQALGHPVKATLIGPLTFLWLGKEKGNGKGRGWSQHGRLDLLEKLLPVYGQILARLAALGVEWVQIDEPILGLDLPPAWQQAFEPTYWALGSAQVKLLLTTYFSPLQDNLRMACQLPVAGLHVDLVRAPQDLTPILGWLPTHKLLSLGVVDGRNIWRTDLDAVLQQIRPVHAQRKGQLLLSSSCSLLHVPVSLAGEAGAQCSAAMLPWLAFAREKLGELRTLQRALDAGEAAVATELEGARAVLAARRVHPGMRVEAVQTRLAALPADADRRQSAFTVRQARQRARLNLPLLPTTTIGSFPQTREIRAARAAFRRGEIDAACYDARMRDEIAEAVRKQESLGLDVLVHGEAERNDMVEYFGEQLDGFAFTANGWVQSYGSRCVKPPVIFGDVSRSQAMTVGWTRYAQSLTDKPMKGMLTGPITLLQWSFVRDDQPRATTAMQIALAIRDEVRDLEAAGIGIIQIDEPALREGLPLRRSEWKAYLDWATRAFRIAASDVADATQIHTHMCYAEFNDILPEIAAMDADVITIETSRSGMELLSGFGAFRYPNEIGPGVYDIHSPRVPQVADMRRLLQKAVQVIPAEQLWVNPDCGLKTRGWPETEAALANMVAAARQARTAWSAA